MPNRDVVLCHPLRAAIGTYGGSLKATPAPELGAAVVKAVLDHAMLDPARLGAVVMGNVIQAGGKMNPARQALERAGWSLKDIERVEINEAFAAIAIAVYRELGFDAYGVPPGITTVTGTVVDALRAARLAISDRDAYVAGPPKMLTAVVAHLRAAGIRAEDIRVDAFGVN